MTASLDEIQGLLAEWEKAKAAVPAAALVISREQDLRKKVIATAFPEPAEGVNKFDLANGWALKATCPVTRTVDDAAFDLLRPKLAELGVIADTLVKTKLSLETKAYRNLSDATRALVDEALTIKPGSYTLELVPPKG